MKCDIRKWQRADAKTLSRLLNNPNIHNNLRDGLPMPYTEADAADYITAMLNADSRQTFAFAITVNGALAGSVGLFRQENIHRRTAELGYYIGEEFWGRGITAAAVSLACAHVFAQSDIVRIFAEPFAENKPSRRVLEKCGFRQEGLMRQNAIKNGRILDMALYALLKDPTAF